MLGDTLSHSCSMCNIKNPSGCFHKEGDVTMRVCCAIAQLLRFVVGVVELFAIVFFMIL